MLARSWLIRVCIFELPADTGSAVSSDPKKMAAAVANATGRRSSPIPMPEQRARGQPICVVYRTVMGVSGA